MSLKDYLDNKSQQLTDQEIITDTLGGQKGLLKMYTTALSEGSNPTIRDLFRKNLSECACDQYSSFEYMQQNNLYPLESAPPDKIKEAQTKFEQQKKNC